MATRTTSRSQAQVGELVTSLSIEQLREVVSAAAERHEDVERAVRLIAARANDGLAAVARGGRPRSSHTTVSALRRELRVGARRPADRRGAAPARH